MFFPCSSAHVIQGHPHRPFWKSQWIPHPHRLHLPPDRIAFRSRTKKSNMFHSLLMKLVQSKVFFFLILIPPYLGYPVEGLPVPLPAFCTYHVVLFQPDGLPPGEVALAQPEEEETLREYVLYFKSSWILLSCSSLLAPSSSLLSPPTPGTEK